MVVQCLDHAPAARCTALRRQHVRAVQGVHGEQLVLGEVGQIPKPLADTGHTDIVQEGGQVDGGSLGTRQPHLPGDGAGHITHPQGVAFRPSLRQVQRLTDDAQEVVQGDRGDPFREIRSATDPQWMVIRRGGKP